MMRKVTILGIAAAMLLSPAGNARAGLFGGSRSYADESDLGGYSEEFGSRQHRGGDRGDRGGQGETRVREVPRRPARLSEIAEQHDRDEDRPRSSRRIDEAAADASRDNESAGFERKMQDLHRQLEEAEQSENPRKIKAVKWMIQKEEERHEKSLASASRAPRVERRRSGPSYEPPDREVGEGLPGRADRGDRIERAPARRRGYEDEEAPRRRSFDEDRPPRRAARREDDEVNNPLLERSRRASREDPDARYRRRADRDEDEQDRNVGRPRRRVLGSNATRVERAEAGIRRIY